MEKKIVEMNAAANDAENNAEQQMSYEDLIKMYNRTHNENMYFRNELEKAYKIISQMQIENGFKRLDCLFKSLQYAHFFDDEYIDKVVTEIKDMLIIKDNDEVPANDKEEEHVDEIANE